MAKIYYIGNMPVSDELYHYGRKGMKWGKNIFEDALIRKDRAAGSRKMSAKEKISRGFDKVKSTVSKTASSAAGSVKSAGKAVSGAAKFAASTASKTASKAASSISSWGKSSVSKGKAVLSGIFSNKSLKEKELVDSRKNLHNVNMDMGISFVKYRPGLSYASYYNQRDPLNEKKALRAYERERKAVADYMKEVQNSPISKLSKLINNPKNVSDWVFSIPGNERHIDDITSGFIPKTKNIKEWFTGDNYKRAQIEFEGHVRDYDELEKEGIEIFGKDSGHVKDVRKYRELASNQADANKNLYENAPRQRLARAISGIGKKKKK